MYEGQDYYTILNRMLDRIPNTVDKREGSIIFDALAPAAKELEAFYIALDNVLAQSAILTADRDYLILHAAGFNMSPYPASYAIVKAEITFSEEGVTCPIGTIFNYQGICNFTVIEKLDEENMYALQCDQAGEIGNTAEGTIIPRFTMNYLTKARIIGLSIPGEEEEDTEALRARVVENFQNKAFGGNRADYLQKLNAIPGIGGAKVARATADHLLYVPIYIVDTQWKKPTEEMIDMVQNLILPLDDPPTELTIENNGYGIAPIGHDAHVFGAIEVPIEIGVKVQLKSGISYEQIQPKIQEALEAYFLEKRKTWASVDNVLIQVVGLETIIFSVEGVVDVLNITLNGERSNITLEEYEIPILGDIVQIDDSGPEDGDFNCPDCNCEGKCSNCPKAMKP